MKSGFFLIVFTLVVSFLSAKSIPFSTPKKTVENHLHYSREESFDPTKASQSLYPKGYSEQEIIQRSKMLHAIFDGAGLYLELSETPNNKNYLDSLEEEHRYTISKMYPTIYLEKIDNRWYYSPETIQAIPTIYKEVFPFGTHLLLQFLPQLGEEIYFGLHVWQYLGLLLSLLISFLAFFILNIFLSKTLELFIKKNKFSAIVENHIEPLSRPASWFVIFWLMSLFIPVIQLPIKVSSFIILGLRSCTPIIATIIIYRAVNIFAQFLEKKAAKTESTLDDQLVPLVRKAMKTFVIIIGCLFILQNLNVNITALLAGLSIGGLAFALAAQDTLKNFFGSLMIFLDRPFQIGDWVIGSDLDGEVEEVGFRATRIRTFHNSVTYIPNGIIADMTVDNMGKREYRRYKTTLGLTYDTPASKMEEFIKGLEEIVLNHPHTRKDYYNIFFNSYGASSLNILFYIFFKTENWTGELRAKQEINLEILKLAERIGVSFAFPTQTLHIEKPAE